MQTQSIQNQQPNKPQAPKSAPLPNNDFKQALSLEFERAPVCAAPEQPAPPSTQAKPPRNAQGAKPAQQPQNASQAEANQAGQAANAAPATNDASAKPVTAQAPAADETAESTEAATAAGDPAAGMLAMLAAYGQLATARAEPRAELPATDTGIDTDAAALAALQADGTGKGATLADLAADARAGKALADDTSGTSSLQDALAENAATRLLKPDAGATLAADRKAGDFAAKLAANVADAAPVAQPVAQPAAQALAATVQAANAAAASALQARVGSSAWEQQLGQKVVWMVAGGDQSASLTLNPPDLGPLQVVLNVSNDSATATFTAHQAETRQAIENALPKLREMMSESGISLGNASVNDGSAGQRQAHHDAGQQGNGRAGTGGQDRNGSAADAEARVAARPVRAGENRALVDT
ncbi:MAG TPA: flagellar hook-length control protein FliK, partial [Pseudoduganella sp.]